GGVVSRSRSFPAWLTAAIGTSPRGRHPDTPARKRGSSHSESPRPIAHLLKQLVTFPIRIFGSVLWGKLGAVVLAVAFGLGLVCARCRWIDPRFTGRRHLLAIRTITALALLSGGLSLHEVYRHALTRFDVYHLRPIDGLAIVHPLRAERVR